MQEKRPMGIVGRFFITLQNLWGLFWGNVFDYVRHKKSSGVATTIPLLILRFILIFVRPFMDPKLLQQPFPVQLRLRLEKLGPTYIKLGQILSLREDLLPKPVTDELKHLLDRLPVVSFDRYVELLEKDLQRPLDSIFLWIDPMPLGSASLAQIHRARLISRDNVVLKVLKPGVAITIERDVKLLRFFGRILQILIPRYQPRRLIDEFCRYTLREVDLRNEADNIEVFTANFRDEPDVSFPKVYRQFSSRNLLCMEYFEGVKPDALALEKLTSAERKRVIDLGVGAVIRMIFRDGFFHADLHPANLIIFPDASVGFIDLGMVGRFDRDMQKRMFYYFYSLVVGDAAGAARYLASLTIPGRKSNVDGFRRSLEELYERWLRSPNFYEFSLAQVILRSISLAAEYRIQYPGEIILMIKALVTVEGVGNLLEPGLDVVAVSRKHVQRLLIQQLNPFRIISGSLLVIPELVDTLTRSPLIVNEGLQVLETNLKREPPRRLAGFQGTIFAGFCLLAGVYLLVSGFPWPVWGILILFSFVLAIRA
jgi:ubiquinone biosynthesis protein